MAFLGRFERLPGCLNGNRVLRCYDCGGPGGDAHEASMTGTNALGWRGSLRQNWGIAAVYEVTYFPACFAPVMIRRDSRPPFS